jgi:hypothetical protein
VHTYNGTGNRCCVENLDIQVQCRDFDDGSQVCCYLFKVLSTRSLIFDTSFLARAIEWMMRSARSLCSCRSCLCLSAVVVSTSDHFHSTKVAHICESGSAEGNHWEIWTGSSTS